jgi:hypothetical protein
MLRVNDPSEPGDLTALEPGIGSPPVRNKAAAGGVGPAKVALATMTATIGMASPAKVVASGTKVWRLGDACGDQ